MHTSGKGKNSASILKYHGKMWYNFAVPHFAVPNFAPAKPHPVQLSKAALNVCESFVLYLVCVCVCVL